RVPTIPGLALPQHAASELVAIAALAFAAAPAAIATLPTAPAHGAPATLTFIDTSTPPATPPEEPAALQTRAVRPEPAAATVDYIVKRGDSLWRIAERLLGDGTRYPEIAALNTD